MASLPPRRVKGHSGTFDSVAFSTTTLLLGITSVRSLATVAGSVIGSVNQLASPRLTKVTSRNASNQGFQGIFRGLAVVGVSMLQKLRETCRNSVSRPSAALPCRATAERIIVPESECESTRASRQSKSRATHVAIDRMRPECLG